MASPTETSKDLYEAAVDLATCTICLEPMKIPKHLQCFHTFCQTCISAYCKSQCSEGSKGKLTLSCPVCRLEIVANESAKGKSFSPDIWAEKLPSNFFIVELLERAKIENRVKNCVSCERLGEKNEAGLYCIECAELYCNTCSRYHQAQTLLITHTIKEVSEVSDKDMKSSQQSCPHHQGEILKLYCSDHDIECCSICVSVDHRKCETVKTLENAAKDIRDSEMLTTVREYLHTSLKELTTLKDRYSQDGTAFQETLLSEIEELNITRTEIKAKVDDVFDQLIANLTQYSEDFDAKYERKMAEIENQTDMISKELKTLNVALEKASNVQIMSTLKELSKLTSYHKETIEQQHKEYFHVHFNTNREKENHQIISSLEKMCVSSITENCDYPRTCNTLMPLELSKMVKIKLEGEYNEACFTSNNTLCVANFNSKSIEIYNLKGEQTNVTQLTYTPYNIASDRQGNIAILNRADGRVEIYDDKTLNTERTYDINEDVHDGIAVSADYFVVSANNSLTCYEREKGTVVKQLSGLKNISWYVCIDEKSFYYSCDDMIYCQSILKDENGVFTDQYLKHVQGIVTDKQRNMLLSEKDQDSIVQISSDRTSSHILLSQDNGIDRPQGIDLSVDQTQLLVMNNLGHSVLVFKVEPEAKKETENFKP